MMDDPQRLRLDRAAPRQGRMGSTGPLDVQLLGDGGAGVVEDVVEHQTHRAVLRVLDHEDDRTDEVLVVKLRHGDQDTGTTRRRSVSS